MIETKEAVGEDGQVLVVAVFSGEREILRPGEERRLMSTLTVTVAPETLRIETSYPSRDAGFGDKPSVYEGRHVQRIVLAERAVRSSGGNLADQGEALGRIRDFFALHIGAALNRPN